MTGLTYRDTQPLTLTFTPTGNLESPINLTCMSLDCGRKPEYPEKTHAEHANSTQKGPRWPAGSYPEPSCCEASHRTTMPPVQDKYYANKKELDRVTLQGGALETSFGPGSCTRSNFQAQSAFLSILPTAALKGLYNIWPPFHNHCIIIMVSCLAIERKKKNFTIWTLKCFPPGYFAAVTQCK